VGKRGRENCAQMIRYGRNSRNLSRSVSCWGELVWARAKGSLLRDETPPYEGGKMRRTLSFMPDTLVQGDGGWRRRAARQTLCTVALADAAGCRVYGERILRAMNIYGRITGNRRRENCAQMIKYGRNSGNFTFIGVRQRARESQRPARFTGGLGKPALRYQRLIEFSARAFHSTCTAYRSSGPIIRISFPARRDSVFVIRHFPPSRTR
jgi:hypothetical protein